MSSTLEGRLKANYEEALNVGQNVYVRACTVLLKGVPVADNFIGLSNTQKKNFGFNPAQIRIIESRCPLNVMDITLLHAIQRAFGGLGPGHLNDLLKDFKDLRNVFIHERQTLSLNKRELRARLATLKVLYRSILEELKHHCDPVMIPVLDTDIAAMEAQLLVLNKTMDDHIQDKTEALRQASSKAAIQMTQSTATLDQNINQASVNLNDTINQARTDIRQITANLDQQLSDSTDAAKQKITDTSQMLEGLQQTIQDMTDHLQQTSVGDHTSQQIACPVEASVRPKENVTQTTSADVPTTDVSRTDRHSQLPDLIERLTWKLTHRIVGDKRTADLIGELGNERSCEFLGHNLTYVINLGWERRSGRIIPDVAYIVKFWNPFDGSAKRRNIPDAIEHAIRDFLAKAFNKNLIKEEEAESWMKDSSYVLHGLD